MTDKTGSEEPTGSDVRALDPVVPVVPIGPGTAGGAAPAVLAVPDPIAELPADAAPLADTAEPHAHDHDHPHDHGDGIDHEHEQPGLFDGIVESLRGILGRDKGK